MTTRRLIICRVGRWPATTGGDVYGLIDAPILIGADAVKREAIRIFASTLASAGNLAGDDPDFTRRHLFPSA
ncbi:hypothetical protein GKC29_14855 [Micromonospora sp. WMMC415]|uniref:hypothetical protein n=1 Tax=Micromonospora sp. WMMC415 TaxID=2675222 RepID=UPI0012B4CA88|nr:hypothetical protein [Micromonospora sp. WMMC415]QGN47997.1 hypothetical protein GKC29_14855 [Micromonospora sp. WMMC415]